MLDQLHSNHMTIEKTRPLARELVYWLNMNADTDNTVKQTQPWEKHHLKNSMQTKGGHWDWHIHGK